MTAFPKYPAYKDSAVEWLGEVPEHWSTSKSKWLWSEIIDPSADGSEELLSISQYTGVTPTSETSRSESLEGYRKCQPGDLAMNIMLAWQGGLGISEHHGIISPAYSVFRLKSADNSRFLGFLYRTKLYLDEFARRSTGIVPSRWRLYPDKFGQVLTLLPPRAEQDRIVAFLDEKTAQIDALIAKKQRQIELLDEKMQSATDALFYNLCTKSESTITVNLGKLIQRQDLEVQDGNHGELHPVASDYVDEGIPFLMACNVRPEGVAFSEAAKLPEVKAKKLRTGFARCGDVLLTHKATIGQVAEMPAEMPWPFVMLSPQVVYYRCLTKRIRSSYLAHFMRTPYFQKQLAELALNQSTRGYVGIVAQRKLQIAVPALHTQREFAGKMEHLQHSRAALQLAFRSQIQTLQTLRSTLISHAVTGKIKV